MGAFEKMIDRLPDVFAKNPDSNVYKLFRNVADRFEEGEDTLKTIGRWRDIDYAQGDALERIGRNVDEQRLGRDDELFRSMIKTKIISNLSNGSIETINNVMRSLIGADYIGVFEAWQNDKYFGNEPAAICLVCSPDTYVTTPDINFSGLTYFDGEFLFDGLRVNDPKRVTKINVKDAMKFVRAAGVKIYVLYPDVETIKPVDINHKPIADVKTAFQSDPMQTNDHKLKDRIKLQTKHEHIAYVRFDNEGGHTFNGELLFDADTQRVATQKHIFKLKKDSIIGLSTQNLAQFVTKINNTRGHQIFGGPMLFDGSFTFDGSRNFGEVRHTGSLKVYKKNSLVEEVSI